MSKGLDNQKQVTNNNRAYSLEIIHLDSGNKQKGERELNHRQSLIHKVKLSVQCNKVTNISVTISKAK